MLNRAATFCAHVGWLLSCVPGWIQFYWALGRPRAAQERILRRLIRASRNTAFGHRHGFADISSAATFATRVPLAEYRDFSDAIEAVRRGKPYALAAEQPVLLEPTSGSSAAPKLIPVTATLRREFAAAVEPWIAWLYLAHPSVMLGRHYWAVSPNTPAAETHAPHATGVRIGFSDDADYLGAVGRLVSRRILANPSELRQVTDPDAFSRLTLLFLLADRELRLISVWHPSFLTLLLDAVPRHLPEIIAALRTGELPARGVPESVLASLRRNFCRDPGRADKLSALNLAERPERIAHVWPRLAVVSCWGGASAEPWLGRLRALFPHVHFQPKGLLATEGCVSIPTGCGHKHPAAIASHYLEFAEAGGGKVRPVWELTLGTEYSVVLTTGGGLWRYRLHDRVRVVGFCRATPCLEFLGKDNAVSDLVGEKLSEQHVAEAMTAMRTELGADLAFAMVAAVPGRTGGTPGYQLLYERGALRTPFDAQRAAELLETSFCNNYHYAHARRIGQLDPIRPAEVCEGLKRYRAVRSAAGARIGTIKIPALEPGRQLPAEWWKAASPNKDAPVS